MQEELLMARNIRKSFSGVQALKGVNLCIKTGEIRCLVGENGCGKSTLIKVISGVYVQDDGDIVIAGKVYRRIHPIDAIREGIQVIYQDFSLFPNLTVAENVALNYQLEKNRRLVNWREVKRVAKEALARIDVNIDLDAYVQELSVADKQLIAISRALLHNAKLVIMDEPTTALTHREVQSLFRVVRGLKQQGVSILFVSHKLNEVLEIADNVTVMRNGLVVADGSATEFDQEKLSYLMTGRRINKASYQWHPSSQTSGGSLLRVSKLCRKGSIEDVSFELHHGEILGITGLLGSGRTELAMCLFGLRPADSGEILLDERPINIRSVPEAVSSGLGYVPEDRLTQGLFLTQSIGKNIVASVYNKLLGRFGLVDSDKVKSEIKKWLEGLRIATPSADLPVQSLSGGNQQRIVVAKWLATSPRVLILNGPTVGVDVGSKAEIHETLRTLARQGIGIIVISDDIPELLQICNRILLMRNGRIADEFSSMRISENELAQRLTGA